MCSWEEATRAFSTLPSCPELLPLYQQSTIVIGNLKCILSVTDKTMRQEIYKDIEDLNDTIHQFDLIDTPTNNSRIHILFKCTQNIYPNKPFFYHKT